MSLSQKSTTSFSYFSYLFLIVTLAPVCLLSALMVDLYMPIMPLISDNLECTFQQVQLSLSLPLFIGGISQMFWGVIFDRFGLRKTLAYSVLIFCVGCFCCAIAKHYSFFLCGRLLQAIGANGLQLFAMSLAKLSAQEAQRGPLMTQMIGLSGTAPIFAPYLGSVLNFYWGNWKGIFIFLGLYSFILGVILSYCYLAFMKHKDQNISTKKLATTKPLIQRLQTILCDRVFFQGLWIQPLMLLGLILFFSFSSFYLQSILALDPWIYRWLTGSHAFIYVTSSLLLAPYFSKNPEQTLKHGLFFLFGIYLFLFIMSTFSEVSVQIFAICSLSMAPCYAVMYGLSFSYALKNIHSDLGLATAILGTFQFSLVSFITTFAFGNGDIGISHYATPLLVMSLVVIFMQYAPQMMLALKPSSQIKGM